MFLMLMLAMILGEDTKPLKVMFFGDSLVSGVHNSQASICSFRYDFLRNLKKEGKTVAVVGTNTDIKGTCQKIGEELSTNHNGYPNAKIDEILDYIAADLQYLYDPVDYLFTSVGSQDCLRVEEVSDFQIISQSVRRIMGRLLNLNENAKIYHVPIMLPPTARKEAVECMDFVNQKLRDLYGPEKNHARIRMINPLEGKNLTEDMFYIIGETKGVTKAALISPKETGTTPKAPALVSATPPAAPVAAAPVTTDKSTTPVVPPSTKVAAATLVAPHAKSVSAATQVAGPVSSIKAPAPVAATPVTQPVPSIKAPVPAEAPVTTVTSSSAPVLTPNVSDVTPAATPAAPAVKQGAMEIRRLKQKQSLEYLPKPELTRNIANVLISVLDWSFRAQTPPPTKEVTKEPEYYGYNWCKGKYGEDNCFEYYYGYVWCLQGYTKEECYNYYYGEVEEWQEKDSLKWCLNFYDEEYCSFAYQGNEPDTWDWLSFGYHDCIKVKANTECFEEYYGYAWCVAEYEDKDCYQYYYGAEDWEWDIESNMKWCLNFYNDEECASRYQGGDTTPSVTWAITPESSTNKTIRTGAILAAVALAIWCCYKKNNYFGKRGYSRLETRYT